MLEESSCTAESVPTRQQHVGEGVAAVDAPIDERLEAKAIVIGARHDIQLVYRVDDDVLLVLRLVALRAVDEREQSVVDDRVGVRAWKWRIEGRRGEGSPPAP